jgi:hypothetical protein
MPGWLSKAVNYPGGSRRVTLRRDRDRFNHRTCIAVRRVGLTLDCGTPAPLCFTVGCFYPIFWSNQKRSRGFALQRLFHNHKESQMQSKAKLLYCCQALRVN